MTALTASPHDWNTPGEAPWGAHPCVVDETFRDGLQSSSALDPPLERKLAALHAMAALGVEFASVGLPAAGPRAAHDAVCLVRELAVAGLPIRPTAAARTTENDVRAIVEVSQRAGLGVDVYAFIGCSPIRQYVESWSVPWLVECVRASGEFARREGMRFCLVLEDTTRTPPDVLREMFSAAISVGAVRVCLCDTVGHADPYGARALVTFALETLRALGAPDVSLDWHGHNDRGLALANALAAAHAGARGIHATCGGIGERTGNVSLEHLLVQLAAAGVRPPVSPAALETYRELASLIPYEGPSMPPTEPLVPLRLRVNGETVEIATRPSRTLLELLRYDLDLVGTKQGCDEGACGACTVLVDGEPMLSCLTLAAACEGREVHTVESLSGAPSLDPLLRAFDCTGAGQCGFCTPGMLMTAKALLARERRPSRQRIREAISGNLCRCTGYRPIIEAIELAAREDTSGDARPEGPLPKPLPSHDEQGKRR